MIQLRKNSRPWSVAPAGDRRPRSRKLRLELLEDRRLLAAVPEGLFGEQDIISADADKARSVFAADVDGDGDMDVLSASNGKVAWYENDGSGGFTAHTISSAISAGWSVFAADMDGDGDLDVLSASSKDGKIAWYENLSPIPEPTADLTGNGFVDFEDLTVLLGNWNRSVSAVEGNLVDAAGTPVNFEDLTVLLADWTGPGPAGSPVDRGLAATIAAAEVVRSDRIHAVQQDPMNRVTTSASVQTSLRTESLKRRGKPAAYGAGRADSRANALRRLQAATDRALADYEPEELEHHEMRGARRWRRGR